MRRPQRRSKPKPRVALAAVGEVSREELNRMENTASYRPSPYHKSSGGPETDAAPRPDKTICDGPATGGHRKPLLLLRAGIRRGMVSRQTRRGWPRQVWAVGDDGVVYEGQLSNEQTGEYHGYPMKKGDGFAGFIGEEWERRGT